MIKPKKKYNILVRNKSNLKSKLFQFQLKAKPFYFCLITISQFYFSAWLCFFVKLVYVCCVWLPICFTFFFLAFLFVFRISLMCLPKVWKSNFSGSYFFLIFLPRSSNSYYFYDYGYDPMSINTSSTLFFSFFFAFSLIMYYHYTVITLLKLKPDTVRQTERHRRMKTKPHSSHIHRYLWECENMKIKELCFVLLS